MIASTNSQTKATLTTRRVLAALGALVVTVLVACGGGGSSGSGTVGGTGAGGADVCAPGSSTSCTCHAVSSPGTQACLADGSGYGPCTEQDGGTCACPAGRSDGCCSGDGLCCSCVKGCDSTHEFMFPDPAGDALIACVCASGMCAAACKSECEGGGIGADCAPCVKQLGMSECSAQYQACGGK
ncbi:MAG: hypothetical protein ABI193_23895 [Minicystis sp.]